MRPAYRRTAPVHDAKAPIGDAELTARKTAGRDGSERLASAIDALVDRTAKRIAIPAEHADRPTDFARAYLGFEVFV